MKTAIISIVVIIILLAAYFIISSKKTEAPLLENEGELSSNQEESFEISSVENGTYSVDTSSSKVMWTGRKKILTNWIDTGTINIQSGSVVVEDGNIVSNELIMDMSSINAETTGSGKGQDSLSKHLKSEDFFDVENHPTSTFVAKEFNTENGLKVTGDLTIKGITNEVTIDLTISKEDSNYILKGSTDLDRTLWDIKFGSEKFFQGLGDNIIEDNFTIEFEIVASLNE